MTIQYPNKLDPKRPIYFAMDHTSSKDSTIQNTVVTKLKNAGLTVARSAVGPSQMYNGMKAVYDSGQTNAIIFNLFNGVDPSNIREVAVNGNDNRGRTVRARGNDAVLAWFYDSCDPVNTDGRCYTHVRASETGAEMYNPNAYMRENKIYCISACSDMSTKKANADYTGEKIAQKFIDLFDFSGSTTTPEGTTTVDDATVTTEDGETKTITTKTTTQYYAAPFYEKVIKLKTDSNGAFKTTQKLPYRGKYKVTMKFGGDKTHSNFTKTVYLYNFSGASEVFNEKLLQTTVVTKYSDNTTTTDTTGNLGNETHYKKVITTDTYSKGNVTKSTSKTVYSDDIIEESTSTDTTTTDDNDTDSPNTVTDTDSITKINPFKQNVPLLEGVPNVMSMAINNKEFEMIDTNKNYILTQAQLKAVINRDSRILQVNNYENTKYTIFETQSSDKYMVLERMRWNCIEESIHYYLVANNNAPWPDNINIDFKNKRTIINNTVKDITNIADSNLTGKVINWYDGNANLLEKRYYHWVGDLQHDGYNCGPTSASVCTQVYHCYQSQARMSGLVGATRSSGSSPDQIQRGLGKVSIKGTCISSNKKDKARTELTSHRPYIAHMKGHYFCLTDLFLSQDRLLICNSSSGTSYGGQTGWHSWSGHNIGFSFGQTVATQLNYTIADTEKDELLHFVASMGGSWIRPYNQEKLRSV